MKIAIVTRQMIIGGVEKALIGMLGKMNPTDEVDLYVEQTGGELFDELPEWINVIVIPRSKKEPKEQLLKDRVNGFLQRCRLHLSKNYIKQCELSVRCFPIIDKKYDLAISYHAPNTIPVFYTIHNLKAEKKILWLHGDVETNHMTNHLAKDYYERYSKIFAVSRQSKDIFDKYFPEMASKCEIFYNIIDYNNLWKLAEKAPSYCDDFQGLRIMTIARLEPQKGIDMAIEVCKRLLEEGILIRWYVCGEGASRTELEELIARYQIQNSFVLLGSQKNPYGYLRDCDIYVQPSRFEGYCTSTNEAKAFAKVIVATDVCGMREQFTDGENALLCEIDEDDIYDKLRKLCKSMEMRRKLAEKTYTIEQNESILRLYQI